jgi:U3 small nucleolar ribonucleoprotein protein IMP4
MSILITTSRRPTRRIRTFCHDITYSVPNTIRFNRGKLNLNGLTKKALENNVNRLVIINRWKGGPGKISFFLIDAEKGLHHIPPALYISGIKLQREFGVKVSTTQPLIITTQFSPPQQLKKIAEFFSNYFKLPLSQRPLSTPQRSLHFSCSPTNLIHITFLRFPENQEVGPQIKISNLRWKI